MTDTTHEAPERIWTWKDEAFDVLVSNEHGDPRYTPKSAREYVRADRIEELEAKLAQQDDLVQAAVAAQQKTPPAETDGAS